MVMTNQSERDKMLSRSIVEAIADRDLGRAMRLSKLLKEERKVTQANRIGAGLKR